MHSTQGSERKYPAGAIPNRPQPRPIPNLPFRILPCMAAHYSWALDPHTGPGASECPMFLILPESNMSTQNWRGSPLRRVVERLVQREHWRCKGAAGGWVVAAVGPYVAGRVWRVMGMRRAPACLVGGAPQTNPLLWVFLESCEFFSPFLSQ